MVKSKLTLTDHDHSKVILIERLWTIVRISLAAAQPNVYLDLSVSAYPPLSPRSPNATSPTFVSFDLNQTSFNF